MSSDPNVIVIKGNPEIKLDTDASLNLKLDQASADTLAKEFARGVTGGDALKTGLAAAIAGALAGEGGLGGAEVKEKLGFGKDGFEKGAALRFVLQPLGRELTKGIQEILSGIDENIKGARFGGGAGALETFRGASAESFRNITGIDSADFGVTEQEITKAVADLTKLEAPFKQLRSNLGKTQYDKQINELARTFAALEKAGVPADKLKDQIQSLAQDGTKSIGDISKSLLEDFGPRIAYFAKMTNQSLGTVGASFADFTKQLAFLGDDMNTEAGKLSLISDKLGVSLGGIFTKDLVSFDEAAELGASLGTVLQGINFDLNDFVNSKPSERVEMVLGELASAMDEGRFEIEEDGVKLGQQVSILQQALGGEFDKSQITALLRRAREGGGGDTIRTVIEEAMTLGGGALSQEEFGEGIRAQRTTDEARDAEIQRSLSRTGVGDLRGGAISGIDEFNKNLRENNFLDQSMPLVKALEEFNIITGKFGTEGEGPLVGLVRNALLADVNPGEVVSSFFTRVQEAEGEVGKTVGALEGRLKETMDALAGFSTGVGTAAEKMSKAFGDIDKDGITGFSTKITDSIVQAFASPRVTDAIAESMRKAGVAAVNNTKVGGPP